MPQFRSYKAFVSASPGDLAKMAHKRPFCGGGGDESEDSDKRLNVYSNRFYRTFKCVKIERNLLESASFAAETESIFRKIVREAADQSVESFLSSHHGQVESSGSRRYRLQFKTGTKLPESIFTDNKVMSEGNSAMEVFLQDTYSNQKVTTGPLSSLKVKIVVVHCDFKSKDWTLNEFNSKIVKNREGKRPLITGELVVSLQGGVAAILHIKFNDNSSWCRSKKFRLGVQPLLDSLKTSIHEAISNPFQVKDHRGESYRKLYPPYLDAEVWRLDHIAKDGPHHKSLMDFGVSNVRDLLKLYLTDKQELIKLLSGCSNKKLDSIIEHAMKCPSDGKKYMYNSRLSQGTAVLYFDSGYRIVGVEFDRHSYLSMDKLSKNQKERVESMKQDAYKNRQHWNVVAETSYDQALTPYQDFDIDPTEVGCCYWMNESGSWAYL